MTAAQTSVAEVLACIVAAAAAEQQRELEPCTCTHGIALHEFKGGVNASSGVRGRCSVQSWPSGDRCPCRGFRPVDSEE